MYPASRTARLYRIAPDAAAIRQQGFGIGSHGLNAHALHPDVRGLSVTMLAVGRTLHRFVVGGGTVCARDCHRLPEMIPDFLQQGHKLKVSIRFRGREMAHTSLGLDVHKRFAEALEGKAVIDKQPKLEGRSMMMFMSPVPNK